MSDTIKTTIPSLKAEARTVKGSRAVKELRAQGLVTAQIYGKGKENVELQVVERDLERALRGVPNILELELAAGKEYGLIKEVQYDTFGQDVLNIDLQRVDLTDMVEVSVPIDYYGTPKGADVGGRLEVMWNEVRIRVRADSIPDQISVDVSPLALDVGYTFSDLELPEGSELLQAPHTLICRCALSRRAAALKRASEKPAE